MDPSNDACPSAQPLRTPEALCEVCRGLDFKSMLQRLPQEAHGIALGSVDAVFSRKHCAFCRLVTTATKDQWVRRGYAAGIMGHGKTRAEHVGQCYLSLETGDRRNGNKRTPNFVVLVPLPFSPRGAGPDELVISRMIRILDVDARLVGLEKWFHISAVQDRINVLQVRTWLDVCERKHGDVCVCVPPRPISNDFRVIDVRERNIIRAPDPVRYTALSYVWGQVKMLQNSLKLCEELEEPGSLGRYWNQLPAVVQDAMALIVDLGERYLWVDALCIIQDDPASKHRQISRMADIYGNAWLTVVALASKDSNSPLPGVRPSSPPRPSTQHVENVDGVRLAVESGTLDAYDAGATIWASRAWTYQEKMLSKRLLYIGHDVVRFECRQFEFKEDVDSTALVEFLIKTDNKSPKKDQLSLQTLPDYVEDYSIRQLSFPSDIQNAFTGITTKLGERGHLFTFGLPLSTLSRALLWRPYTRVTRREGFPSWSWMGWIGRIRFGYPAGSGNNIVDGIWCKPEVEIEVQGAALQFDSSSARFNVTLSRAILFEGQNMGSRQRPQPELRMLILDDDGHQCGATQDFYPDSDWEKGVAEHEFVLAGRERASLYEELGCYVSVKSASDVDTLLERHELENPWLPRGDVDVYDSAIYRPGEWITLRVLQITRKGNEIRRLATGYIHEDAWVRAKPRKESFRLV